MQCAISPNNVFTLFYQLNYISVSESLVKYKYKYSTHTQTKKKRERIRNLFLLMVKMGFTRIPSNSWASRDRPYEGVHNQLKCHFGNLSRI